MADEAAPSPAQETFQRKARPLQKGDIDPLRVVVWSLFGVLVLGAWGAILWFILRVGS